ncbi:MAG: hypothetical protein Fur0041_01160 [Bacteroidia bacterium]
MSFPYGPGIQGLLPHDFTKEQVIGNLRVLMRLGFCKRIVEVIHGKAFMFRMQDGEVVMDEPSETQEERILESWDDGFYGTLTGDDWKVIAPEAASVFLPTDKDLFEQLSNVQGNPIYIDSIGNAVKRIIEVMDALNEEANEEEYAHWNYILDKFRSALEHSFVIAVSY